MLRSILAALAALVLITVTLIPDDASARGRGGVLFAALDHPHHLGEVAAHRRDDVDAGCVQQPVDPHQPAVDRQRVQ